MGPIRKFCSKGSQLGVSKHSQAGGRDVCSGLWDHREKELTLARDRLGEKPLVYFYDRRDLAFASEMKALREFHGGTLEPLAVDAYLALGYVPAPLAIFRGVKNSEPGHVLRLKPGGEPRVSRWWPAEPAAPRRKARLIGRRLYANEWARRFASACAPMFPWRSA